MTSGNERTSRVSPVGRWTLSTVCALVALGAPGQGRADEARLCDSDWDGQSFIVQIGKRKNDGKPLQPYDPSQPMAPYELPGDRYLFGERGKVYRAIGRFSDRKEGEEALRKVETEMTYLYTNSYPPFLTSPGAYLVTESPICKIDRRNPVIDPSSWILEKNGVLLVGTDTGCTGGKRTKKVTVVSCDGMKNLVTDSVAASCESNRVNTCIYPVAPDVFAFEHYYSQPGSGTEVRLRIYDVRKKKRLQSIDRSNDDGPDTELMKVKDVDNDGIPEIVFSIAGSGEQTSMLKWRKGKFLEVKTP
ncbi:hypothetical protein [Vitiosangium sp. GDMCC 1.1324]|uniref:hypothetical protein n=1 Tax=Vitiosangium sp. (strain GDMCC 1.1324) TaxID=2138576 RepID=UPI000D3B5E0E|nr:hypothetical protein [Vitiosangium sp. GDMCC 1.1324]PTL76910.1 hypothetical protein DAT35_47440 [Vitiosangium sp. GDMCC 1.1324]